MDTLFTVLLLDPLFLSWNLLIVGTLKQHKSYIPKKMKKSKHKEEQSYVFGFSEDGKATIYSYVSKKERMVILLSLITHYSTLFNKWKTLHWPQAVFFNMLDVATLAVYIFLFQKQPYLE